MKGLSLLVTICLFVLNSFADTVDSLRNNFKFYVIDMRTREPLDSAVIKISCAKDSSSVSVVTGKNGIAEVDLRNGTSYRIEWSKRTHECSTRYFSYTGTFLKSEALNYKVLELEKIRRSHGCGYVRVENIYFDANKTFVRPDGAKELDKLARIMIDNPTLEIEIMGHSDCRGTQAGNMAASLKRVEATLQYLITKGVPEKRMKISAWGDTKLVNPCDCLSNRGNSCSEVEHQENRRVEFKIVKFN